MFSDDNRGYCAQQDIWAFYHGAFFQQHCMENSSVNILLNFSFCVPRNKLFRFGKTCCLIYCYWKSVNQYCYHHSTNQTKLPPISCFAALYLGSRESYLWKCLWQNETPGSSRADSRVFTGFLKGVSEFKARKVLKSWVPISSAEASCIASIFSLLWENDVMDSIKFCFITDCVVTAINSILLLHLIISEN